MVSNGLELRSHLAILFISDSVSVNLHSRNWTVVGEKGVHVKSCFTVCNEAHSSCAGKVSALKNKEIAGN